MGLINRSEGKYLTILNGKFCQRVPDTTVGAVQRTNKLGKVVYELFYDSFVGKLVGIKTTDTPYGKSWVFDFQDDKDTYHLQLSYSNSYAKAILKMLPNIDVSKEIKLSPQIKEVDGKSKSSLFINQDGVSIKHAYTKDLPNGLPQMKQVKVAGNMVWDDTEALEFLEAMVKSTILPKLDKVESKQEESALGEVKDESSEGEEEPF